MKRRGITRSRKPLKRSPLRSSQTAPKRRGGIKRKAKSPSKFAFQYGSKARVTFVKHRRCIVERFSCDMGPTENAHIGRAAGAGLKGHYTTIVSMCPFHHNRWHTIGRQSFLAAYNLTDEQLVLLAEQTEAAWRVFSGEAATE